MTWDGIATIDWPVREGFSQGDRQYMRKRKFGENTELHFVYVEFAESLEIQKDMSIGLTRSGAQKEVWESLLYGWWLRVDEV